jgi:hypothetical protein
MGKREIALIVNEILDIEELDRHAYNNWITGLYPDLTV